MRLSEIFNANKKGTNENAEENKNSSLQINAKAAIKELLIMEKEGKLNKSIDEYIQSNEFVKLLAEFDVKAAVRIFDAEAMAKQEQENLLNDLNKKRELPKAMKSSAPAAVETDYGKMSKEEFERLKRILSRG